MLDSFRFFMLSNDQIDERAYTGKQSLPFSFIKFFSSFTSCLCTVMATVFISLDLFTRLCVRWLPSLAKMPDKVLEGLARRYNNSIFFLLTLSMFIFHGFYERNLDSSLGKFDRNEIIFKQGQGQDQEFWLGGPNHSIDTQLKTNYIYSLVYCKQKLSKCLAPYF